MLDLKDYSISYRITHSDGSITSQFVNIRSFSFHSALRKFEDIVFVDSDGLFSDNDVEIISMHKV